MENKSHALWAGFFTIAMLCATILAGIWLNRDKTMRKDYVIVTDRAISGLNPQASVRYKGLAVGRVEDIRFDKDLRGQIDINISVDMNTPITKSTFATLGYQGVTGIAFIQLDDDGTNRTQLPSGTGMASHIPLRLGFLEKLERSGSTILSHVELVVQRLGQLLAPDNQKTMLNAFQGATEATQSWTNVAKELKPTLERMPQVTDQASQTMASVQGLVTQATQLTQQLNNFTEQLQNPKGPFNQTLLSYGDLSQSVQSQTLPKISELTNDMSRTLQALNKTLTELNERPESLIFGKPAMQPGPGEDGFVQPN